MTYEIVFLSRLGCSVQGLWHSGIICRTFCWLLDSYSCYSSRCRQSHIQVYWNWTACCHLSCEPWLVLCWLLTCLQQRKEAGHLELIFFGLLVLQLCHNSVDAGIDLACGLPYMANRKTGVLKCCLPASGMMSGIIAEMFHCCECSQWLCTLRTCLHFPWSVCLGLECSLLLSLNAVSRVLRVSGR